MSHIDGYISTTTDNQQIGYTLTLRNQLDAASVSIELRDLTAKLQGVTSELKDLQKLSVDDSAVVKIVTVMSAVYLPGTFIVVRDIPERISTHLTGHRAFMV